LALPSLAGDLALNDATLRETLHGRDLLTIGIPHTVEPLSPTPTPEEIRRLRHEAGLHGKRTPPPVQLACACGYRRPIVESLIASLLGRGAARTGRNLSRKALISLEEHPLRPPLAPTTARRAPVRDLLAHCTQAVAEGTTDNETAP
jgi:hypothetical protein